MQSFSPVAPWLIARKNSHAASSGVIARYCWQDGQSVAGPAGGWHSYTNKNTACNATIRGWPGVVTLRSRSTSCATYFGDPSMLTCNSRPKTNPGVKVNTDRCTSSKLRQSDEHRGCWLPRHCRNISGLTRRRTSTAKAGAHSTGVDQCACTLCRNRFQMHRELQQFHCIRLSPKLADRTECRRKETSSDGKCRCHALRR